MTHSYHFQPLFMTGFTTYGFFWCIIMTLVSCQWHKSRIKCNVIIQTAGAVINIRCVSELIPHKEAAKVRFLECSKCCENVQFGSHMVKKTKTAHFPALQTKQSRVYIQFRLHINCELNTYTKKIIKKQKSSNQFYIATTSLSILSY